MAISLEVVIKIATQVNTPKWFRIEIRIYGWTTIDKYSNFESTEQGIYNQSMEVDSTTLLRAGVDIYDSLEVKVILEDLNENWLDTY